MESGLFGLQGYILWVIFGLFVGVALAIDLGAIGALRKWLGAKKTILKNQRSEDEKKKSTFKQALTWTVVWISLAAIFAGIIYLTSGYDSFLEFVTGYTLEKSLSIDNMFVFIVIFTSLGIPHLFQHKVLSVGIISAIAMRIPLIIIGASLIENFHWMMYIFGAFLLVTGIRMAIQKKEQKINIEKNIAVRLLKRFVPVTPNLSEGRFLVRLMDGALYATPMLVALVIVEMTDLVFAVDSIPAVLAITTDPFIVITSNIFAILGLRSLYFLVAGLMEKFYYLKAALVALLIFIGSKMLITDLFKLPIEVSLIVVFATLGIALGLSALKARSKIKSHATISKWDFDSK